MERRVRGPRNVLAIETVMRRGERPIEAGPAPELLRLRSVVRGSTGGLQASARCSSNIESQEGPGRSCHPPRVFPASQPSQKLQDFVLCSPRLLHLPRAQSRQELQPFPRLYLPEAQGSHEVLELNPLLAVPGAPAQAKSAMSAIGRGRPGGRFGKEGRSASAIRASAI